MSSFFDKISIQIGICCLVYVIFCMIIYLVSGTYLFMSWNLFLAVVPLILALALERCAANAEGIRCAVLGLLWLLFYPNAPYLVTDIMHVRWLKFFTEDTTYNLLSWARVLVIATGVLLGGLSGNLSLWKVQRLIRVRWGGGAAAVTLGTVFLLSGYAIYIGRFLRLNSSDIVRPAYLIRALLESVSPFALAASLLFGLYTAFTYWVFLLFFRETSDSGKDVAQA